MFLVAVAHGLRVISKFVFFSVRKLFNFIDMWVLVTLQSYFASFGKYRKVIFIALLLLMLLLYMWPHLLRIRHRNPKFDPAISCMESAMSKYADSVSAYDSVIISPDQPSNFLPFVGNGYFAFSPGADKKLYIRHEKSLSLSVNFYPFISVELESTSSGGGSKTETVMDFQKGVVHHVICIRVESVCVQATSHTFAHRTRPGVLVQELSIRNPLSDKVQLRLRHVRASEWMGAHTKEFETVTSAGERLQYWLTSGSVLVSGTNQGEPDTVVVAVCSPRVDETVEIGPARSAHFTFITTVHYPAARVTQSQAAAHIARAERTGRVWLEQSLAVDRTQLRRQHVDAWSRLWRTGFSISRSMAADALNGDRVNATIYALLSQVRAPLHEVPLPPPPPPADTASNSSRNGSDRQEQQPPQVEKSQMQSAIEYTDSCYSNHQTLQAQALWTAEATVEGLAQLSLRWLMTLDKHGCTQLVRAGADGIIQAMVLSFGGMRFTSHHLEFHTHPRDLHRDLHFRRISYGAATHVNITVRVGSDNRAGLFVSLDRSDRPYFACDAGCLDAPVRLGQTPSRFPVKLTDPLTPILYITSDTEHMNELKHTIHVRELVEAPPHEHHVMALHRHGHSFGGLPLLFWLSIAFLVVVFHLFLVKLIINEYCAQQERYVRTRYQL